MWLLAGCQVGGCAKLASLQLTMVPTLVPCSKCKTGIHGKQLVVRCMTCKNKNHAACFGIEDRKDVPKFESDFQ